MTSKEELTTAKQYADAATRFIEGLNLEAQAGLRPDPALVTGVLNSSRLLNCAAQKLELIVRGHEIPQVSV